MQSELCGNRMAMDVEIQDNSEKIKKEADLAEEKVLFQWGLLGVEGCVEKASEIDAATGRPTVDTGRYRAGFGFITPKNGRMSGTPAREKEQADDFSAQRSEPKTVVIANNVEYAEYLEFGTGKKQKGKHARYIMKRGIESKLDKIKSVSESVFKGQDVGVSIGNIVKG